MSADIDRSICGNYDCGGFWRSFGVSSHDMVEAQVYDTCVQTCGKMRVC